MAISLFPINEGETLGNNIARYAEYMGNVSTRELRQRLFGYKCAATARLPCGISYLASQTRDYWNLDADQIITRHTELNYRTMMASPAMRTEICTTMLSLPTLGVLRGNLGMKGERGAQSGYCNECLAECYSTGIAPYFKIRHQLPGTYYCDIHFSLLNGVEKQLISEVSDVSLQRLMSKHDSPVLRNVAISEARAIRDVAQKNARQLMEGSTRELSHYRDLVRNAGFLLPDGRLRRAAFVTEWLGFFGPEYCHLTGLNEQKIGEWWKLVSAGTNEVVLPSPFMFVAADSLLESIVSGSATNLPRIPQFPVDSLLSKLPRCTGCLHRDSDSYGVLRCDRRSQIWMISCSCGITYRVSANSKDIVATIKPVAHGERYNHYFHELLAATGSVRFVARELGVSRRVAAAWKKAKIVSGSELEAHLRKRLGRVEIAALRREWRKLVRDALPPERRITVARRAGEAIYEKLIHHDHDWLLNFNKSQTIPRLGRTYSSKNELTGAKLKSIEQIYEELLQTEPPVRVTGAAILKKGGFRFHVRYNKDWSALISRLTESRSAYFARVLLWLHALPMSKRPRTANEFERLTHCSCLRRLPEEQQSQIYAYLNC